jgi:hypothetical protein
MSQFTDIKLSKLTMDDHHLVMRDPNLPNVDDDEEDSIAELDDGPDDGTDEVSFEFDDGPDDGTDALAELLENCCATRSLIEDKIRKSQGRGDLLIAVHKTIKENQKELVKGLENGSLTKKKLSAIVEAFRVLVTKMCNIMGRTVVDLGLFQEVVALLQKIPKKGYGEDRILFLKFIFNSLNLEVSLLLKGNAEHVDDLKDVVKAFVETAAAINDCIDDPTDERY